MKSITKFVSLMLGVLLLPGCGGEKLTTVTGQIRWENAPVAKGRMEFAPVDGKTASVAGIIQDGKYSVEVPPGEKIVRIFAFIEKGTRKVDDGFGDVFDVPNTEQILPPEMNVESKITWTVEGKTQVFNYGDEKE